MTPPTSGHAAVYLYFDLLQRRLPGRSATRPAACATSPTSTTTSCAGPANSVSTTSIWRPRRWPASTPRWASWTCCPSYSRAPGDLGHPRHPLPHRGRSRRRPRLPVRGLLLFDASSFAAFGRVSHLRGPRMFEWRQNRAAIQKIPTSATPSTSSSGSPPPPTNRPGSPARVRADRGGISSVRPWRCVSSARRSISMAAAGTSCSPTTSARRRSPSR